jgi:putative FmdB family regulatory protein
MPIYDYRCQDCGKTSEILLHEVNNAKLITCPLCGSQRMERLLSASYLLQAETREPGKTCCGRSERCETPPCSSDRGCQTH